MLNIHLNVICNLSICVVTKLGEGLNAGKFVLR